MDEPIEFELTDEEVAAISVLRRLAKRWPKSLWLFVDTNTLNVMRKDESGNQAHTAEGGCDWEYSVATIGIECGAGLF